MYSLIPLLETDWQKWIRKPRRMKMAKVRDLLKDFYVIRAGEMLCKTPIGDDDRQIILFNSLQGKIGTYKDNIPTRLTLDSHSDDIKRELERYYKHYAERVA